MTTVETTVTISINEEGQSMEELEAGTTLLRAVKGPLFKESNGIDITNFSRPGSPRVAVQGG